MTTDSVMQVTTSQWKKLRLAGRTECSISGMILDVV
jgi:hypothetical protein